MPEEMKNKIERRFTPKAELEAIREKVKEAPKEKQSPLRRELMEKFKDEFISQKEGIAEIKDKIESVILNNPDASADEIFENVRELTEEHHLGVRQEIEVRRAIYKYVAKHGIIEDYVNSYHRRFPEEKGVGQWQKEFFKDIFGFYPKGEIGLDVGPMNLYWKCYNADDFARAFGDKDEAEKTVGFQTSHSALPGLEGTMNVENSSLVKSASDSESTKRHEEMHTIKNLLMPENKRLDKNLPEKLSVPEDILQAVKAAVRNEAGNIYDRAEGEILAHLKEGGIRIERVIKIILGVYEYFNRSKKKIIKRISELLLKKYPEQEQEDFFSLIGNEIDEARDDYHLAVLRAMEALIDISEIPKYSLPDDLVFILSAEPIEKWGRLAGLLWGKYIKGMNRKELEELMEEMTAREKWTIIPRIENFLSKQRMGGDKSLKY